MDYPSHDVYRRLYARYFQGNRTQQMLELVGDLRGKRIADLCGGGGRLSELALAAGARVTLVDESAAMATLVHPGLTSFLRDVRAWLQDARVRKGFHALFCQQAVNYWFGADMVDPLADALAPGGFFVFNTFNRKPGPTPMLKQYQLEGAQFVEASWLSGEGMVEHVQMREGEPPHTTRFQWIAPEQYRDWLGRRFDTREIRDGAASVWCCTRKA